MLDDAVVTYLDDILIFSPDLETHHRALNAVFAHLAENQLYLQPEKCALLLKYVELLGYIIDADGVHVQSAKICELSEWPPPYM